MNGATKEDRALAGPTYDLAGALNRVVLDGEATGGTVTVVEVTMLPGAATPLHSDAREDLVWYVVDGTLDLNTEGGSQSLGAGESAFFPRGVAHAAVNSGSSNVTAIMVATPSGVEGFLREASTLLPAGVPSAPPPPEALGAFAELAAKYGITLH